MYTFVFVCVMVNFTLFYAWDTFLIFFSFSDIPPPKKKVGQWAVGQIQPFVPLGSDLPQEVGKVLSSVTFVRNFLG